jgi:YgiT-type zinc finger domain-containing protein
MKANQKTKNKGKTGFWDGERCEYCQGLIIEKIVDLPRRSGSKYILIKNVPVGVCKECGTRYFSANILKTIKAIINGRQKAKKEICIPVYSFRISHAALHMKG